MATRSADEVVVRINGTEQRIVSASLQEVLQQAGFEHAHVATAVNGAFVARDDRESCTIVAGDEIEVVTPRQGG
ncbi:MAG: sulfur carrier protein ThiS [Pseudomonadota bacterium]